jgi:hypothetical protein
VNGQDDFGRLILHPAERVMLDFAQYHLRCARDCLDKVRELQKAPVVAIEDLFELTDKAEKHLEDLL